MKKITVILTAITFLVTIFATPAAARSWDFELPGSVSTIIENQAEVKYPSDGNMRRHFRKKQAQAWLDISNLSKPSGLDQRELKRIKTGAAIKWPADYKMQYHRIKKQVTAWRTFKDFKQPKNFNSSFKFKKLKKEYKRRYPRDHKMRLYNFKKALAEGN